MDSDNFPLWFWKAVVRLCYHRVTKEPLTPEDIRNMVSHFITNTQQLSLTDLRDVTFIVLSYAAFMRYDEISNLKRSDVVFV